MSIKALAALVVLLGLAGPASADPVQFRDEARNISFVYNDDVWRPVTIEGSSAIIEIEWRLLGGEYLANCWLVAYRSGFAATIEGRVHEMGNVFIDMYTAPIREHDPNAELLASETRVIGTQEVVRLRQRFFFSKPPGNAMAVTLDTLYTVREGEDILFECRHLERPYEGAELRTHVEKQIRLVTESLSFGS